MKRCIALLLGVALVCLAVEVWTRGGGSSANSDATTSSKYADPADAHLLQSQEKAGWVFGRLVGVSNAPGTANYSPFGGPTDSISERSTLTAH